jgi:GNAT superfamily N-acetyltransferase
MGGLPAESEYRLIEMLPSISDYRRLRAAVGWSELPPEATKKGLESSLYSVCVRRGEEVVGCGRVVGDTAVYFYIQDVIVLPEHQGRGLGARIMGRIMAYLDGHAHRNSFIALMAAKGAEGFYERYGFARRPPDRPGMVLIWGERSSRGCPMMSE